MAATQLAEYNGHAHSTWLPARSYRYSPYQLPHYSTTEPPTRNVMPPVQMPTPSPPHHGRPYHESERMGPDTVGSTDGTIYVQSFPSSQPTILTTPFDVVPAVPASQPIIVGSPLIHESDLHESKSVCAKDESPTESHCPTMSLTSIPRSLDCSGPGPVRRNSSRPLTSKDVFERVQGRFSLLGSSNKYNVTVGEIKRRINPPECLNTSLLGGLLRRGKGKNGGTDLRQKLDSVGLILPPGRRKATSVSMLTSMVEAEAQDLSNQFTKVCQALFPAAELARNVAQAQEIHLQRPGMREDNARNVKAALQLVGEFRELLEHYIAQEEIDRDQPDAPMTGLRSFSLITHSFGVTTISGVMGTFQAYLTSLLKYSSGMNMVDENMYHHHHHHHHQQHQQHQHQHQQHPHQHRYHQR